MSSTKSNAQYVVMIVKMMKTGNVTFKMIAEYVKASDESEEFKHSIAKQFTATRGEDEEKSGMPVFDGTKERLEEMIVEAKRLVAEARLYRDLSDEAKEQIAIAKELYQSTKSASSKSNGSRSPAKKSESPKKSSGSSKIVPKGAETVYRDDVEEALSEGLEEALQVEVALAISKAEADEVLEEKLEEKAAPPMLYLQALKQGRSWASDSEDEEDDEEKSKTVSRKSTITTKIAKNGGTTEEKNEAEMKTFVSKSKMKFVKFVEKKEKEEKQEQEIVEGRLNVQYPVEFSEYIRNGMRPCTNGYSCKRRQCDFMHIHDDDYCPTKFTGEVCKNVNLVDKTRCCQKIHVQRCRNSPCQHKNCTFLHSYNMPNAGAIRRFKETEDEYRTLVKGGGYRV